MENELQSMMGDFRGMIYRWGNRGDIILIMGVEEAARCGIVVWNQGLDRDGWERVCDWSWMGYR
jgi:hypothetical protein